MIHSVSVRAMLASLALGFLCVGSGAHAQNATARDDPLPTHGVLIGPVSSEASVVATELPVAPSVVLSCPSGYVQSGSVCVPVTPPAVPAASWTGATLQFERYWRSYATGLCHTTEANGGINFNADGTFTTIVDSCSTTLSNTFPSNWISPTAAGTGNNYWIHLSYVSGSIGGGASTPFNQWLNLGSFRWIDVMAGSTANSSNPGVSQSAVVNIEIASDSAGANIVEQGNVTITAIVAP